MKLNQHLKDWKQIVSCRFPDLSLPQVNGLATWSLGIVMTHSSSLTKVSNLIAKVNHEKENTVRQRLKEWYKSGESQAKIGTKRASLEVSECFSSLLKWIIDLLPQTNQELPIGMDATNIGQNFTVLSINVLYRRCAIPVAWKVIQGTSKGSWKPYWQELFQSLKDIVPEDYLVIVSMVTLGGEQEFADLEPKSVDHNSSPSFTPSISCFLNGLLTVIAQLLNGQSISFGRLFPLSLSHFNNLAFSNSS